MKLPALALACLLLTGCASTIRELAKDSAIVGTTGWWVEVGVSGVGAAVGLPLPALRLGYGTLWRVGPHQEVEIEVGATGGAPGASGSATLRVRAKGLPAAAP